MFDCYAIVAILAHSITPLFNSSTMDFIEHNIQNALTYQIRIDTMND